MSATDSTLWRFEALDTWFFRESRPHGAVGASELASLFPPPARTVAGAVRTFLGEAQGVDWRRFPADYPDLHALIGLGDDLGALDLRGPFLLHAGERLYPVPLHLLARQRPDVKPSDPEQHDYVFLRPGEPVDCDLGCVRLPELATPMPGAKPLERTWLKAADFARVLAGEAPDAAYRADALYDEEPRLGIARNNARGTVEESMLYQTRHLRLRADVAAGVQVAGPVAHPAGGVLRFGGEGRPAAVRIGGDCPLPSPALPGKDDGVLLVLLTPADLGGNWLPADFERKQHDGADVWCGELHGVALTVHAACLGKPVREGGWDLARNTPRAVVPLAPAGSVWFCTLDDPAKAAALHGARIGKDTQLGRGELAVGRWKP